MGELSGEVLVDEENPLGRHLRAIPLFGRPVRRIPKASFSSPHPHVNLCWATLASVTRSGH
jgi:hypothetical protein